MASSKDESKDMDLQKNTKSNNYRFKIECEEIDIKNENENNKQDSEFRGDELYYPTSYIDNEVEGLLLSWGFSYQVIQKITDLKLTVWHISVIEDSDIDALFPALTELADRIKFKSRVKIWRKARLVTEPERTESPVSTSSTNSTIQTYELGSKFMHLEQILNSSPKGKKFRECFKSKQSLTENDRKHLVDIIVDSSLHIGKRLSVSDIEKYSEEIVEIFPTELKDTYFMPRVRNGNPKGKLYDRIRNAKRTWMTRGLIDKKPPTSPVKHLKEQKEPELHEDNDLYKELKVWLKLNKEDSDWSEICSKWKICIKERVSEIRTRPFCTTIEDWPLYKHPKAPYLINLDFEHLYPNKENHLFSKWGEFKNISKTVFEHHVKDKQGLQDLHDLKSSRLEANADFLTLKLLHTLLKPTCRIRKKDKKIWKPSILDSQESQMLIIANIADLQKSVSDRIEKYNQVGLKVQPFIIIVNQESPEYFVWVENVTQKFDNFLKSVDFAFKVFHLFNFHYPKESELVWTFLQIYFYEIILKCDSNSPQLLTYIATFKKYNI